MPIVKLVQSDPFVDGRQSARAMTVRNGVERHLTEMGWVTLPEMTLKTGRRADLVALSPKGTIIIVEVKSSLADLRADNKWPDYFDYCDELYFATLPDVPQDEFPKEAGLLIADNYGAHILREANEQKLSPARRKEVSLRFARTSAHRLSMLCAHAGAMSEDFDDG